MTRLHQQAENIIDRTMNIDGDISFKGATIVEGRIRGTVTGETIIVTETGEIIGDLVMEKVVCRGKITGTITTQSLSIGSSAQVKGQLDSVILEIGLGAEIDCEIKNSSHQLSKKEVNESVAQVNEVEFVPTATEIVEEVEINEVRKAAEKDKESVQEQVKQVAEKSEKSIQEIVEQVDQKIEEPALQSPPVSIEPLGGSGFFREGDREIIAQSIIEGIKTSKEMIKIIGDLGSGKTTICQKVCDGLSGSYKVVRPDNVVGSIKELLLRIADALDIQIDEKSSQTDILDKLKDNLTADNEPSEAIVLVLDNSHEMYPATLEGIIKNLGYSLSIGWKMMQIVLFGDRFLDDQLDPKVFDYFQYNPECTFTLRPLSKNETRAYIDFKLNVMQRCMNSEQPIDFPDDSAAKVYTFSQGVIGRIDRIVEEAVELAGKKKKDKVVAKFVKNI